MFAVVTVFWHRCHNTVWLQTKWSFSLLYTIHVINSFIVSEVSGHCQKVQRGFSGIKCDVNMQLDMFEMAVKIFLPAICVASHMQLYKSFHRPSIQVLVNNYNVILPAAYIPQTFKTSIMTTLVYFSNITRITIIIIQTNFACINSGNCSKKSLLKDSIPMLFITTLLNHVNQPSEHSQTQQTTLFITYKTLTNITKT